MGRLAGAGWGGTPGLGKRTWGRAARGCTCGAPGLVVPAKNTRPAGVGRLPSAGETSGATAFGMGDCGFEA